MGAELTPIVPVDCCARAASARSEGKGEWEGSLLAEWLCIGSEGLLFPRLVPSPKELLAVAPCVACCS